MSHPYKVDIQYNETSKRYAVLLIHEGKNETRHVGEYDTPEATRRVAFLLLDAVSQAYLAGMANAHDTMLKAFDEAAAKQVTTGTVQ